MSPNLHKTMTSSNHRKHKRRALSKSMQKRVLPSKASEPPKYRNEQKLKRAYQNSREKKKVRIHKKKGTNEKIEPFASLPGPSAHVRCPAGPQPSQATRAAQAPPATPQVARATQARPTHAHTPRRRPRPRRSGAPRRCVPDAPQAPVTMTSAPRRCVRPGHPRPRRSHAPRRCLQKGVYIYMSCMCAPPPSYIYICVHPASACLGCRPLVLHGCGVHACVHMCLIFSALFRKIHTPSWPAISYRIVRSSSRLFPKSTCGSSSSHTRT